jgi:hypothetical protein
LLTPRCNTTGKYMINTCGRPPAMGTPFWLAHQVSEVLHVAESSRQPRPPRPGSHWSSAPPVGYGQIDRRFAAPRRPTMTMPPINGVLASLLYLSA